MTNNQNSNSTANSAGTSCLASVQQAIARQLQISRASVRRILKKTSIER